MTVFNLNRLRKNFFYFVIKLSVLLGACVSSQTMAQTVFFSEQEQFQEWSKTSNHFGMQLYQHLQQTPSNFCFSPVALLKNFLLLNETLTDPLKTHLKNAFQIDLTQAEFKSLQTNLNRFLTFRPSSLPTDFQLFLPTSLWYEVSLPFVNTQFNQVPYDIRGGIRRVDFIRKTETTQDMINQWIRMQTRGKVRTIVENPEQIKFNQLLLVNACLIQARWQRAFDPNLTQLLSFYGTNEQLSPLPQMTITGSFPFASLDEGTLIEVPYLRSNTERTVELSLFIYLPNENISLSDVSRKLSLSMLDSWTGQLQLQQVVLSLPKFHITSVLDLTAILQRLNLKELFKGTEEFSLLIGKKQMAVTQVLHTSPFSIDESGTGAVKTKSTLFQLNPVLPLKIFRVNRPFLFFVREKVTNLLILIGHYNTP